jgi:protein disulfide-isomerase A6
MLLLFLTAISRSDVIELNQENLATYIGAATTIFVKFFSPNCQSCQAVQEPFEDGSKLFTDVLFGEVDCIADGEICKAFNVSHYPGFLLFQPYNTTGIAFRGPKEPNSFADFIEHYTLFKSTRPPSKLIELNPLTIEKLTRGCGLAFLYGNYVELTQSHAYSLRTLADIFEFDENITMATWNCAKFPDLCNTISADGLPAIGLCNHGKWRKYSGINTVEEMVAFVNHWCGTERTANGMLNESAGTVAKADKVVSEFLTAVDKRAIIEKAKEIQGAELYVKAMERFIEKGQEQIEKDVQQMNSAIEQRKGSPKVLDMVKRRYNVFRKFLPETANSDQEQSL